jgi:ABC-type nickel/cobalt efflux system permease component RcnA
MTEQQTWLWIGALVLILAIPVWIVWRKGRPFAPGDVFRASRLSAGNHLFPTQVLIAPSSVVQYKPRWIGRLEEVIHMTHVSSVKINTHLLFSDVFIETSGGADPIRCHGHRKGDAVQIKTLIEKYQSDYYRGGTRPATERQP